MWFARVGVPKKEMRIVRKPCDTSVTLGVLAALRSATTKSRQEPMEQAEKAYSSAFRTLVSWSSKLLLKRWRPSLPATKKR